MGSTLLKLGTAVALVTLVGLTLAGCGDGSSEGDDPTPTTSSTGSTSGGADDGDGTNNAGEDLAMSFPTMTCRSGRGRRCR